MSAKKACFKKISVCGQSLEDHLENVYIFDRQSANCAIGRINGNHVLVTYGSKYVGKNCLVRFDMYQKKNFCYIGNAIRETQHQDTTSLGNQHYILCGIISSEEISDKSIGEIYETINAKYDPGEMKAVIYFREDWTEKKEILRIRQNSFEEINASIEQIIQDKYLVNPLKSSRVFLVENNADLFRLIKHISRTGVLPIVMDPRK